MAEASAEAPVAGIVLVVDDDEMVRALVTAGLTRSGHQVVTARDGREALDRIDAAVDGRPPPGRFLTPACFRSGSGLARAASRLGRTGRAAAPVARSSRGGLRTT